MGIKKVLKLVLLLHTNRYKQESCMDTKFGALGDLMVVDSCDERRIFLSYEGYNRDPHEKLAVDFSFI